MQKKNDCECVEVRARTPRKKSSLLRAYIKRAVFVCFFQFFYYYY